MNFGEKTTPATLKLFKRADVTDSTASLIVDFTIELRDPATGDVLFNSGKFSARGADAAALGHRQQHRPRPSR